MHLNLFYDSCDNSKSIKNQINNNYNAVYTYNVFSLYYKLNLANFQVSRYFTGPFKIYWCAEKKVFN